MPSYKTNDPRGWRGDPRRGAALGRVTMHDPESTEVRGRLTLQRVKMSPCGAYDSNGTYFGVGLPLYWCAYDDGDHEIDFVFRAIDRSDARQHVLGLYPNAKVR